MTDSNTILRKKELSCLKKPNKILRTKELMCLKKTINNNNKYVAKIRNLVNNANEIYENDENYDNDENYENYDNDENDELNTAFDASINQFKIIPVIQANLEKLDENIKNILIPKV